MLKHTIAGLPVVETDNVVGLLAESGIFRIVVEAWQAEPAAVNEPSIRERRVAQGVSP